MADFRYDLLSAFLAGVATMTGLAYWFWRYSGQPQP